MRLLTAHKILIGATLALASLLVIWSVVHRAQTNSIFVGLIGVVAIPLLVRYFIKLKTNPPIR